jgi:hypothetical protein
MKEHSHQLEASTITIIVPVKIGNVAILCQWKLEMYQYSAGENWKCSNIVPVGIGNVSI